MSQNRESQGMSYDELVKLACEGDPNADAALDLLGPMEGGDDGGSLTW